MMILSIDTSGACASIAVTTPEKILYESSLSMSRTHSQTLAPMIDTAFGYLGIDAGDIDIYATAIGPGSFTGIRIGIAAIQAMADATGKKVIAVNTLDGLAANAPGHNRVCSMIDARNGQVYFGLYDTCNGVVPLTVCMPVMVQSIDERIDRNGQIVFAGDGALAYQETLSNMFGDRAIFLPPHMMQQRAASIGYLASIKAEGGKILDPHDLRPLYLKKTQAEIKHGESGQG